MAECTAVKANGAPCLQPAMSGTDPPVCLFHNPAAAELREAGRRAGGRNKPLKLPEGSPNSLADIRTNLGYLAAQLQVHEGSTTTVNALIKVYELMIRLEELTTLEARIADLEAADHA